MVRFFQNAPAEQAVEARQVAAPLSGAALVKLEHFPGTVLAEELQIFRKRSLALSFRKPLDPILEFRERDYPEAAIILTLLCWACITVRRAWLKTLRL